MNIFSSTGKPGGGDGGGGPGGQGLGLAIVPQGSGSCANIRHQDNTSSSVNKNLFAIIFIFFKNRESIVIKKLIQTIY
jgi:hypothetical protein